MRSDRVWYFNYMYDFMEAYVFKTLFISEKNCLQSAKSVLLSALNGSEYLNLI